MVDPQVSPYDSTPWQPTIDSSDSDYSDEQSAAKQYDGYYGGTAIQGTTPSGSSDELALYLDPSLAMVYTKAPDLIPTPMQSSGQQSTTTADLSYAPDVYLPDLLSVEQTCLNEVADMIDAYNTVKIAVLNAIGDTTLFGTNIGTPPPPSRAGGTIQWSPFDKEGKAFAASMNPQMEQLVQQAGDAIETVGQFVAMLNAAGQMYAENDATALKAFQNTVIPMTTIWTSPIPDGSGGGSTDDKKEAMRDDSYTQMRPSGTGPTLRSLAATNPPATMRAETSTKPAMVRAEKSTKPAMESAETVTNPAMLRAETVTHLAARDEVQ